MVRRCSRTNRVRMVATGFGDKAPKVSSHIVTGEILFMANQEAGMVRSTEGFTPDVTHELQRSVAMHDRGSFKKGGTVPVTGSYKLHAGETVIPAQTDPTQQDAPGGQDDSQTDDSA